MYTNLFEQNSLKNKFPQFSHQTEIITNWSQSKLKPWLPLNNKRKGQRSGISFSFFVLFSLHIFSGTKQMLRKNLPEFREKLDSPFVFPHNGLDMFGYPLQNLPRFIFSSLFQGLHFPYLVEIAQIHVSVIQNSSLSIWAVNEKP